MDRVCVWPASTKYFISLFLYNSRKPLLRTANKCCIHLDTGYFFCNNKLSPSASPLASPCQDTFPENLFLSYLFRLFNSSASSASSASHSSRGFFLHSFHHNIMLLVEHKSSYSLDHQVLQYEALIGYDLAQRLRSSSVYIPPEDYARNKASRGLGT